MQRSAMPHMSTYEVISRMSKRTSREVYAQEAHTCSHLFAIFLAPRQRSQATAKYKKGPTRRERHLDTTESNSNLASLVEAQQICFMAKFGADSLSLSLFQLIGNSSATTAVRACASQTSLSAIDSGCGKILLCVL